MTPTTRKKAARIHHRWTFVFTLLHLSDGGIDNGRIGSVLRRSDTDGDARLGVVQVERGALAADPRDRGEVVPRRRARRGPLERSTVAPRVVDCDSRSLAGRDPDVEE